MSLLSNLVAYYKLDENSGSSVGDITGNGNTGTWNGTLGSQWTPGIINSGGNFNGTDNYVNVLDSVGVEFTGDFSISLWVKPGASQSAFNNLLRKEIASTSISGYGIEQDGTANHLSYTAGYKDAAGAQGWGTISFVLTSGIFTYLTLVKSGTTLTLYLNAISTSTAAGLNSAVGTDAAALQIGGWPTHDTGRFFTGIQDEIGLWSRGLTQAEVTQLYNGGAGLPYPFATGGGNKNNQDDSYFFNSTD